MLSPSSRLLMSGVRAKVTTTVLPHEDPTAVFASIAAIFPSLEQPHIGDKAFPLSDVSLWEFDGVNLETFLEKISKQRILDTALDSMAANLAADSTTFSISRQAALAGKVAFEAEGGGQSLGGVIKITLSGSGLAGWIERETWHQGRIDYPRAIRDEFAMKEDGESRDWFT